jgi:drug/metabolite transporter (DMT)-like permease
MDPNKAKLRAYGYLALAMVTVGSIVPVSKVLAAEFPVFTATALRLTVAATILIPWALRRQRAALLSGFDLHDKALLATQAAAGTVGFTVLMILGTARTSAADASVVAGSLPAVAVLLSVVLFRERPSRRRWLAVGVAVVAIGVVNAPALTNVHLQAERLGTLLVLGAIGCESLFILLNKRLHRSLPALAHAAAMTALGLVYSVPAALLESRGLDLRGVGVAGWLAVTYYGLVPTVLGFTWWYRGTERVSGAEAGVFTAVMPVAGAVLSAVVLGESLGFRHLAGLALVVAAIALTARSQ